MKEPSISDLLANLGFGHRAHSEIWGTREVFHIETGERLGLMDAGEAVLFLQTHGVC